MSAAPKYQFDRYAPRPPVISVGQAFSREAPQSLEAEAAVLGSLILESSYFREVADIIDDDAFTLQKHRTIFQAIAGLIQRGTPLTMVSLNQWLKDSQALEQVGGLDYLLELAEAVPSATLAAHFAEIVRDVHGKRKLVEAATRLVEGIYTSADPLTDHIERATTMLADATGISGNLPGLSPATFADLQAENPTLALPVIDGILRLGETLNIIAAPKVGKSWLVYSIALSIVTGKYLLATFPCTPGRVLIIDNELHAANLAQRIPKVAEALQIHPDEYADRLDVLSLRGKGIDLPGLQTVMDRIEAGYYSAVILDAWYRFTPAGMNENSNSDVMALYNLLDRYAGQTNAAFVVVHHASKGGQGEKAVTDVGAGAGAQSRAADSHLILRPHEEDGHVVLEAAVRSFAPVEPIALRWDFPLWTRAHNVDTSALKGRKSKADERQDAKDAEGMVEILDALQAEPLTERAIRRKTGMGQDRAIRLLGMLTRDEKLLTNNITVNGNSATEYRLSPPVV